MMNLADSNTKEDLFLRSLPKIVFDSNAVVVVALQ
jgi:hypothetical protein